MAEYTEDELYDMSDEELEKVFKESKAELADADNEIDNAEPDEETEQAGSDEIEQESDSDESDDEIEADDDSTEDKNETVDEENKDIDNKEPDEVSDEEQTEDGEKELEQPTNKDSTEKAEEKKNIVPEVPTNFKIKANGSEIELTQEELIKLAPKALDYTRKMQEIAPWRRTISALKDNGLTEEDINLFISAKKGDKDAIAAMVKQANVDPLDLEVSEEAEKYVPTNYGKSEQELAIEDIVSNISRDPEYSTTQYVINNKWDNKSQQELFEHPEYIQGLHADVKSGVFDKVSPIAMKLAAMDGGRKSDIEYYIAAGNEYYGNLAIQEQRQKEAEAEQTRLQKVVTQVEKENQKEVVTKKAASKRKAATQTKSSATKPSVIDYLDDNDEAFDEWYKQLEARS